MIDISISHKMLKRLILIPIPALISNIILLILKHILLVTMRVVLLVEMLLKALLIKKLRLIPHCYSETFFFSFSFLVK